MNKFYLHIILILISFGSLAQNDLKQNQFDRNKWDKLRKSIKYEGQKREPAQMNQNDGSFENSEGYSGSGGNGYGQGGGSSSGSGSGSSKNNSRDLSNKDFQREVPDFEPIEAPQFEPPNMSISPMVLYVILGIVVIAILALIVYFIVKNAGGNKGVKTGLSDIEIHDVNPLEIPKTELELRLEQAMKDGDYRECVRIYFIFSMKALVENGHIRWKKEKTNMNYLQEVFGKSFYGSFNNTVNLFEIVWYGEREITQSQFALVEPELKKCISKID